MSDELKRMLDDFLTKAQEARQRAVEIENVGYYLGLEAGLKYAAGEVKKVLDDTNVKNRRTTADTE